MIRPENRCKLYEEILMQLPYPIFLKDSNGHFIACNKAFSNFFNFNPDQIQGLTDYDLFSEKLADKYRSDDKKVLNAEEPLVIEELFEYKGNTRTVLTIKSKIKDPENNSNAIVGYFRDITEYNETVGQYEKSEKQYKFIFDNIDLQIKYSDIHGKILMANKASITAFGKDEDAIIGKSPYQLFDQATAINIMEGVRYIVDTGNSIERLHKVNYPNLGTKYVWSKSSPVISNNIIEGIQVISQDVTKLKESEKALKESELRFRTLFYEDEAIKLLIDPVTGDILDANNAAVDFYEYSIDELKAKKISEINLLEPQSVFKSMGSAMEKQKNIFQFKHKIKSGEIKIVKVYATPINVNNQKVLCSTIHDVTNEKEAIKHLQQSETMFRNIFNHSNDGMIITNEKNKIIDINEQILKLTGFKSTDIINQSIDKILHLTYGMQGNESDLITVNNKKIPVEIGKSEICARTNFQQVWVLRDITERKSTEKQVLAATIETENKERQMLAEQLHDDLAPLLSSLKFYNNVLSRTDDLDKRKEILGIINELTQGAIDITKGISNNLNPNMLSNLGLQQAIIDYCKKIEIEGFIKFHLSFPPDLEFIKKEKEITIYRILKELINNSLKHAHADNITLQIKKVEDELIIHYYDDGIGFDMDIEIHKRNQKMGLLNILSRITTLNGKYQTSIETHNGFEITITLNLDQLN